MATLTLLGDSIIDNRLYVGEGEPDVPVQIAAALPSFTIDHRAVDGHRMADVRRLLAERVPAGPVLLSVGGNDALDSRERLTDPTPMTMAEALTVLHTIRADFHASYAALLDALAPAQPLMVATIYAPRFEGMEAATQRAAEAGLSALNDVIRGEAAARGAAILDLWRLFDAPEDYANDIEPSAVGGAKIAAAVAAWCESAGEAPHS